MALFSFLLFFFFLVFLALWGGFDGWRVTACGVGSKGNFTKLRWRNKTREEGKKRKKKKKFSWIGGLDDVLQMDMFTLAPS